MDEDDKDEEQQLDPRVLAVPDLLPGDRCITNPGGKSAVVKYVGALSGLPKGYWVGVQYDDKVGKNDGRINGRRYFRCPPGHGSFIRGTKLKKDTAPIANEVAEAKLQPDSVKKPGSLKPLPVADLTDGAASRRSAETVSPTGEDASGTHLDESMASRIARRRKDTARERQAQTKGYWERSIEDWNREVGPNRDPGQATPDASYATGPGLDKAVVGSLAQFTVLAHNAQGQRVDNGGDQFVVRMRGLASGPGSQPAMVRTKITDRGDGSYMVDYRPWLTGTFSVSVMLHGCNIKGSPYHVSVITLRPDPPKCIVRGDALHHAIARTPMKFEVLFVDAIGNVAQAEDLDVYLDPYEDLKDQQQEHDVVEELPSGAGSAEDVASNMPRKRSKSPRRSTSPRRVTSLGTRTIGEGDGLEAHDRQRHIQLWDLRTTTDKLRSRAMGEGSGGEGGARRNKQELTPTNYAHELSIDPLGFAFGGVDPGTLHAHGKLMKVHSVHYSVGLAGRYKLHVGLRQQMTPLPGSPFDLCVEPGEAYALSSKLPTANLPLSGVADEDWQHALVFTTADVLGNACTKGGARVAMTLSKAAQRGESGSTPPVEFMVEDLNNGSYKLKWKSHKTGTYPIDVTIDGTPVAGSPIQLFVHSAKPSVEYMQIIGGGMSKAVAGIKAELRVSVADRFGNKFEAGSQNFPYRYGLLLNPSGGVQQTEKMEKKIKAKGIDKDGADKRAKEDERKASSIPFEGRVNGSVYEISYEAKEAGLMDLHVWASPANGNPTTDREPLPGSPFSVHVSEGNAAAAGSYVGEAEASRTSGGDQKFLAGEHVILRPQIRDQFGNPTAAAEGSLVAVWDKPGKEHGPGEQLPPPKARGGLGSYELVVEPTKAGTHQVHILLDGEDISDSPVSFLVSPAGPAHQKCKLHRKEPPEHEPLLEKSPIVIVATLFDKHSNQLDHGGVRVDAKPSGVGVGTAKIEDNNDGTYNISMMAGPPGEIKVAVRIDGNDLQPPFNLVVQRNSEQEQAANSKDSEEEAAPDEAAKNGNGKPGKEKEKSKDKDKGEEKSEGAGMPPAVKPVPWMSPAAVRAIAGEIQVAAAEKQAEAEDVYKTFEARLGNAILAKVGNKPGKKEMQELISEWDRNGDEEISKIEFRQCVTGKSLNLKATNAEIDAFFATLDADGGGSIDLKEIKPALTKLHKKSQGLDKRSKELNDRAQALRDQAAEVGKIAEDTEWVEKEEKRLATVRETYTAAQKIGYYLWKRNEKSGMKVSEAINDWDRDGSGSVDQKEFRENTRRIGVENVKDKELDELFDKWDVEGDGDLSLKEVQKCFQALMDQGKATEANEKELKKNVIAARKSVARQHAVLMHERETTESSEPN